MPSELVHSPIARRQLALRDACHFKTDYPEIMRLAERYFV